MTKRYEFVCLFKVQWRSSVARRYYNHPTPPQEKASCWFSIHLSRLFIIFSLVGLIPLTRLLSPYPESKIFIIPVRVEECKPSHLKLHEINWVDLFPSYEEGITKLLFVFNPKQTTPIRLPSLNSTSASFQFEERPTLDIQVYPPGGENYIKTHAVIDPSADISLVGETFLESLGTKLPYSFIVVNSASNEFMQVRVYYLDLALGGIRLGSHQVLAGNGEITLIGWDILKDFVILIDGPDKIVKIWQKDNSSS